MKITGGKYRGRNIESRTQKTLRPTTARIRETIFNILTHGKFIYEDDFISDDNPSLIEDRKVIDIFCGTGALAIEALSRGASFAYLIDQNPKTLSLAKENIESLGEDENTSYIRSDSTLLPTAFEKCDVAFVDPPYNKNLGVSAIKSLASNSWLKKGAVVVLEHEKQDNVKEIPNFKKLDDRINDKTRITFYQYLDMQNTSPDL